jgi:DnaK suppressor protein
VEQLDLDHFRRRLLRERAELDQVADTGEAAAATVELDQSRVGRLSRMDAMQGQAVSVEVRARRRARLRRIASALERVESGEYGFCEDCGEPIGRGRLEFDPAADLCIDCATRAEAE